MRMLVKTLTLATCLIAMMSPPTVTRASVQGVESFTWGFTSYPGANTQGWEFTSAAPLSITHLGFWDYPTDGVLLGPHKVSIWDKSTGQVVTSTSVTKDDPSDGMGFRWAAVSPAVLSADHAYIIGGYYGTYADPYAYSLSVTTGSGITWVDGRYISGDQMPTSSPGPGYQYWGYLGPNFKGNVVPEPAMLQLPLLLGMGILGFWCRRRNHG